MKERVSKAQYYLDIATSVLERSTCLRRQYGDEIIATGYNGAPRGRKNCCELGYCYREAHQIPSGERYELCRSVHAEANAIISAARRDMQGADLYLAGRDGSTHELLAHVTSCSMCRRLIINSGIRKVYALSKIHHDGEDKTVINSVDVQKDWVENDDSIFPSGETDHPTN